VFYASLFIGLGSIGNNDQESQSIMSFLSLVIMVPIFLAAQIIENPQSTLSKFFSYFPLTTAPMMTMRVNLTEVDILEKIITLVILLISIYGSIWFSGKIFRVGILSYGKVPNISEIIKWLKAK
jgi:ABC-2 type transport system permease protein